MTAPRYSIVIPTYRRGESLAECLESVCALQYPLDRIEVIVVDNGGDQHTRAAASPFMDRLSIRYLVNISNRGYGFSVNRGIVESTGECIMLLNDDARPSPDILRQCDALLERDRTIGCVGCRAVERGYHDLGEGIGRLTNRGVVLGNFDVDCGEPIEVEHVYGFCYVFTREAVRQAGLNDRTLLAQPYSSGNCIETDHCLNIRAKGLKVVYHPRMVALHLAQPRPDMSEVSLRWHLNFIRNPIYLYLKHFGLFGKGGSALRLTFLMHVGLLSAIRRPNRANLAYFANGLHARASAYWHYVTFLAGPRFDSPEAFRAELDAEMPSASCDAAASVARSH